MDLENKMQELKPFLNENMQLTALPAKYKKKLKAYYYLATKLYRWRFMIAICAEHGRFALIAVRFIHIRASAHPLEV